MKKVEDLAAYQVLEKREIPDIQSVGYLVRHKKTGARLALLSNNDDNKVFYIGFRTPPRNSTGVAHILEHSVLCGSREFPVKDPFVELVKGSLNTFLNAITYPDKTLYPVASCNDKDFQNLMHVYLDAVFYPNIYQKEAIFRQEGWHYELDEKTGELSFNGVVYNEMKGAYSDPDDVLNREIMRSLYPHTTYAWESGGDPEAIPDLTYEEFLNFHRTYYHPSNSYLYLYGNMDMAEKLEFIDSHYLSAFEAIQIHSQVEAEPAFEKPVQVRKEYPITPGENVEENTILSWNLSVSAGLDRELAIAMEVLDYALCSAPGAPLKQALMDRGLGKDVYSFWSTSRKQPVFSVISKGVDIAREQEFLQVIREVLTGIVEKGFDEKALLAGLNYFEFRYREADFGSHPRGLMYGIQMMDSWLYDDKQPFLYIEQNAAFASLKEKVKQGYFEGLIRQYFLENPHCSAVSLYPVEGLGEKRQAALKEKLARIKSGMSEEELEKIRKTKRELDAFRETPDRPEDLAKIPMLKREDIGTAAAKLNNTETRLGEVPTLHHDLFTNGIGYLRLIFRCDQIPREYFPYLGLLKGCLGFLNTEHYSYGDLFNQIYLSTGGIEAVNNVYGQVRNPEEYTVTLDLKTKVLYGNLDQAVALLEEILFTSDYADTKRLSEILGETKSRLQSIMTQAAQYVAVTRALSDCTSAGAVQETLSGISFYRLVAELDADWENRKDAVTETLRALSHMIFRPENLMLDFTGDKEALETLEGPVKGLWDKLYREEVDKERFIPAAAHGNEGFMTSAQVQYVCRAGNFRKKGLPYRGDLKVLTVLMEYEYLWVNVRVKGGAYGCMCSFDRQGDSYFTSYQDPNLEKTLEVYEGAADAVRKFEADERTMTQYIIGAVSDLDRPLTPAIKGLRSLVAYLTGVTDEMLQEERNQVLSATPESLRSLAAYLDAFLGEKRLCVVGNAGKIKEQEDRFDHIENLF